MPAILRVVVYGMAFILGVSSWTTAAETSVVHWTFERTIVPFGLPVSLVGKADYSDEVPAPFVYDPLTKQGRPNGSSFQSDGTEPLSGNLNLEGSFSLEAFVKPLNARDGAFLHKQKTTASATAVGIKLEHFHANNQFYLRGFVASSGEATRMIAPGYYGSSAQWKGEKDTDWRHLALVYDAERSTVSFYIDYYLSRSEKLAHPLSFDSGKFLIGAPNLSGLIDEVRYVPRPLSPALFLRATSTRLQDISYASEQKIAPADAGCINIKEHFGAVGDGRTDDTAAFQRAFQELCSRVPLAYHTLLIPQGTYLISDVVQGGRFIDVKGAGPEQTTLLLKDGVFTNPDSPQPILRMSSSQSPPGSYNGVNGSSISIYLEGLTLDTGKNNPGARGIEYHANNLGRLENVVIRSGDGQGVCGLDLTHHDCGPALVKHVTIEGFDHGVHARYQEYSMTFEYLTLKHQRKAGILNEGNILAIRKLTSVNSVPAIQSKGPNSMITLLDSELKGEQATEPAIISEGGLYALRLVTTGYPIAIQKRKLRESKPVTWDDDQVIGPHVEEYVGDRIVKGLGQSDGALKLPIEETPSPPVPPVETWVNVSNFSQHCVDGDWSPAVQAAIQSGARVIYFPAGERREFRTPIRLHAPLERLVGFGGELNWPASVWNAQGHQEQTDRTTAPPPILIYDEPNPKHVVVIDRLGCVHLHHASPATLVLRSSSVKRYTTGASGGKLFAEDIGGADWHFDHPQHVWVRQWNPESHAAGPCIHSRGATIWALGFKTEYESQKFLANDGAETEILGAFIYPIGKIPPERPIFENRDSRMALVYGASIYHANHKVHIRDVRGQTVKEFGSQALLWAGSRARMDLFVSDATGPSNGD